MHSKDLYLYIYIYILSCRPLVSYSITATPLFPKLPPWHGRDSFQSQSATQLLKPHDHLQKSGEVKMVREGSSTNSSGSVPARKWQPTH